MPKLIRRYGYFECINCGNEWESAKVHCRGFRAAYRQDCRQCKKANWPVRLEQLQCSNCGRRGGCNCLPSFDMENDSRPHRSDLCHKCKSGRPCK